MSASDSATPRLYAKTVPASRATHRAASGGLFRAVLQVCEIAADFLSCTAGMALAFWIQHSLRLDAAPPVRTQQDVAISITAALLAVLLLYKDGAYRDGGSPLQIRETERALQAAVQSVLVLLPFAFFLGLQSAVSVFLAALVLMPALLAASRHACAASARGLRWRGRSKNYAVLYGAGDAAKRVLSALSHMHSLGLHPVLVVDDDRPPEGESIYHLGYRQGSFIPARCGPITAALLQSFQCGALVIALPHSAPASVDAAIQAAQQAGASVTILYGVEPQGRSQSQSQSQSWIRAIDIDGLSPAQQSEPCESRGYVIAKRVLDLIGSSLLLVLLSPLFVLIALLVKLDSPGPAIFIQERVGRWGKHFRMYKFRSMDANAPVYDLSPVTPGDPRITRIGRLLRRTSLDELPQLANVLLGHMSLVGPRPEMPFITHGYTAEQRQRLQVMPGITGLWQLSIARAFPIHENIHHDLYYIRKRTFFMDIAILLHTLFYALRGGI